MTTFCKIVSPSSESDFKEYYQLRWELLRKPWNQPLGSERDELEEEAIHYSAHNEEGLLLGVCRMHFLNKETAQIRFMAVQLAFKGLGIGRKLLEKAEDDAYANGIKKMILQSRENAVVFYQRQGYQTIEKSFQLYGEIQHFLMQKQII